MTYLPRTNAATVLRALRVERITCFVPVPEVLRMLLEGIERRVRDDGEWRQWSVAHRLAGKLPFSVRRLLFRDVHRALGGHLEWVACAQCATRLEGGPGVGRMGVHVYEAYGLAEVTGGATLNTPRMHRLGSVGRPLPGVRQRSQHRRRRPVLLLS